MKSALFVDFDNVFSQLRQLQPEAAERFARHPSDWIEWLTTSLDLPQPHEDGACRRLLVCRCYLNPNCYQSYRHAFLRAGFEIVDCPPVTSQGKTSTDIHMVLDIVDLLQHETRCDEFIVFSADADFTPVLRKLRRYDRRTTVLAIGFPSAAYQASADLMIDERLFLRDALGLGAVSAGLLASKLRQEYPEVTENWNGCGSFKAFYRSLGLSRLLWQSGSGGRVLDPSRHELESELAQQDAESPWAGAQAGFPVIREVCILTGASMLGPKDLKLVVETLAEVLHAGGFELATTAHQVCRRCLDSRGLRVRHRDVTFLMRGMQLNGHVFGQGNDDEVTLASRFVNQILFLCEREQRVLDPAEIEHIRAWVGGGALESSAQGVGEFSGRP